MSIQFPGDPNAYDSRGRRSAGPFGGMGSPFKMRLIMALVVVGIGVMSYLASFQINPVTGERQAVGMNQEQEIALGLQAAPEMIQQMGGVVPRSDPGAQLVAEVGQRLVSVDEVATSPYRGHFQFHLLDDDQTVNAFALPGGQIFITRALLLRLENESQLAGVLGHEVGHVIHRHGAERMASANLTQSVIQGVGVAASDGSAGGQMAAQAAQYVGQMVLMKYGREDELESDSYGLKLMAQTGLDPHGMIRVMEILAEATGNGPRAPQWASTHPDPLARIEQIKQWLAANEDKLKQLQLSPGRTFRVGR
jgi:predicted Zn-dependent protease